MLSADRGADSDTRNRLPAAAMKALFTLIVLSRRNPRSDDAERDDDLTQA
jgi:hypothetical protein